MRGTWNLSPCCKPVAGMWSILRENPCRLHDIFLITTMGAPLTIYTLHCMHSGSFLFVLYYLKILWTLESIELVTGLLYNPDMSVERKLKGNSQHCFLLYCILCAFCTFCLPPSSSCYEESSRPNSVFLFSH